MGAASRKESPTPTQTLLASIALMRRSLGRLAAPRRAAALLLPGSLALSLAGPARAERRAPAPARSQSVFHANPRAASFPSTVTAPLPLGLPASSPAPRHLLPRAPCPPPASGRAPGLPRPARSTPTWATGDGGGPDWSAQDPARPRPQPGGRLEEVVGKERREGAPGAEPTLRKLSWSCGPERVRFEANKRRPAKGRRCTPGWTPVREGAHRRLRPRKLGRTLRRARADPGQGPWPATATRGLLLFSSLRSHRLKDPRLCVEGVGRGEK